MASNTTNYNLHKIDLNDAPPDITVLNGNWDTIDAKLKEVEDTAASGGALETRVRNVEVHNTNQEESKAEIWSGVYTGDGLYNSNHKSIAVPKVPRYFTVYSKGASWGQQKYHFEWHGPQYQDNEAHYATVYVDETSGGNVKVRTQLHVVVRDRAYKLDLTDPTQAASYATYPWSLEWYNTNNAEDQLNISGMEYYYTIIMRGTTLPKA